MDRLPYLERVKIQSEILLPLYRLLRDELGEAGAARLLREAVREYAEGLGRAAAQDGTGSSLERLRTLMPAFTAGNALDVEPVVDDAHELTMNVRGCRYAEYFHALGEPAFGAMLTCEIDPPMTRAIGDDLSLERSQTIMGGASHCDFHWTLAPRDPPA
ncbi:MAG: L-2-amino-thiazoline-4-carboxylic acid hydrolase [Gammaproteobacteria bacterium]